MEPHIVPAAELWAMLRSCASSAIGSTPSAFITASTMESESISASVGSRKRQLIGFPKCRAIAKEIILLVSFFL
jgi:hypothetical protein